MNAHADPDRIHDLGVGFSLATMDFSQGRLAPSPQSGVVASLMKVVQSVAGRLSHVGELPQAQPLGYLPLANGAAHAIDQHHVLAEGESFLDPFADAF